jgi:hypothetical protein
MSSTLDELNYIVPIQDRPRSFTYAPPGCPTLPRCVGAGEYRTALARIL